MKRYIKLNLARIICAAFIATFSAALVASDYDYYESNGDEDISHEDDFDMDAPIDEDYRGHGGSDPVEGYWIATNQRTGDPLAGWHFYIKDGKLYGRLLSAKGATAKTIAERAHNSYPDFPSAENPKTMKMLGNVWIWGLRRKSEGDWRGGYIVNPDDGACFKISVKYRKADGDKYKRDYLLMRGSLRGLTLLGVTQKWPAATFEEASGIK